MTEWYAQRAHGVRFDWGPEGARRLAHQRGCLIVVDVLSFTTAVSVAVEKGTAVLPFPWRDERAAGYAAEHRAALAVGRSAVAPDRPYSLSPAALRRAPFTDRLVLPSPNGSTIAAAGAERGGTVAAGSLRNATATARWLADQGFGTPEHPVVVIASGERWPGAEDRHGLRPALEDVLGAGAVIAALDRAGVRARSPEAEFVRAGFTAMTDLPVTLRACASGVELRGNGFPEDVEIAAELDGCDVPAVLRDGAFTA